MYKDIGDSKGHLKKAHQCYLDAAALYPEDDEYHTCSSRSLSYLIVLLTLLLCFSHTQIGTGLSSGTGSAIERDNSSRYASHRCCENNAPHLGVLNTDAARIKSFTLWPPQDTIGGCGGLRQGVCSFDLDPGTVCTLVKASTDVCFPSGVDICPV